MDVTQLRHLLVELLKGEETHMGFEEAVKDFPEDRINEFPPNVEYTPWHLLEHLRITQWDILDFIRNSNYKYIKWPDDYWPPKNRKATKKDWNKTVKDCLTDLKELMEMAEDPKLDLFAKIPWGEGQTPLREFLIVFDHNSYHIGEFAILRQIMATWPKK